MAAGQRRRARIAALQALHEADSSRHAPLEVLERLVADQRLARETAAFARDLIQGVLAQQDEIDQAIARAAPAWPVEQLPPVDRNILRLAIREMLGDNGTPVRAVINEAVELAKTFGSESSAKFVNGVLGSIERQRSELRRNQPAAGRG
ncbi:MAG: transcription antitermination factor NusB [Chloroflexi bacterium RBG_16_68_14]|nr:MAG: transcription antitermination factor NusB [Chloroflexi bacterium RBG_16_68_14]